MRHPSHRRFPASGAAVGVLGAVHGERFAGAMRGTVLAPAQDSVNIAFDAGTPGNRALHCHHLRHVAESVPFGSLTAICTAFRAIF